MAVTLAPSPNMQLVLPVVLGEVGPLWASELNTALGTTVDAHDHTTGNGVKVPTAGLNINADLSYAGFGPIAQKYSRFASQAYPGGAYPSAGTLPYSIFVGSDGNLYFQNTNGVGSGSGANVQLTSGDSASSVAGATAGFTGDYNNTTTASARYNSTTTPIYAFFSTPSPLSIVPGTFSSNSVNSLGEIWARDYVALGSTITTSVLQAATAQSAATNADGFKLAKITGARGFVLSTSTTGAGAQGFDQPALYVKSASTTNTYIGMNVDTAGPQAPTHARSNTASTSVLSEVGRLEAYNSNLTTTGFGPSLDCYGSSSVSITPVLRGRIAFPQLSTGAAGVRIQDTTNVGTANATPVLSSNGGGAYGLGVAVAGATATGVYSGATLAPSVDATYDLGTTGLRWASGYFSAAVFTPAITAAAGLTLTATAGALDLRASGAATINTSFAPTSAGGLSCGTSVNYWSLVHTQVGRYWKSGGAVSKDVAYDGLIYYAISVSSGASKVYEYTQNVSATNIAHPGVGQFTVSLSSAVPATQCLFFAQFAEQPNNPNGANVAVHQTSPTTFDIFVTDNEVFADKRWNFLILSTGF